jgi:hypothetical protein
MHDFKKFNIMESKYLAFAFLDWDIFESIEIIRATLAPLRLTRWQMFKYLVASLFRGMSTLSLVLLALGSFASVVFVLNSVSERDPVEKLGIPIVGGSKQHKLDFKEAVEEGKKLVSSTI